MTKLDDLINDALRDQDAAILEATEEQGWFALALGIFSGKLGWIAWMIILAQTMMFLIGVWCAYRFFSAADVLMALKWGLTSAVLIIVAAQLKLSLMPQIQANRIIRELKRVELMIMQNRG